jgi:multicomponent Na+:H+ antiporter subunit A
VLFVLAFHFLPDLFRVKMNFGRRLRDAVIAGSFGLVTTFLILAAHANQIAPSISDWYLANSLPVGFGKNVVNVIVVDFRGLDTQGEIAVLVVAAMGITALLRLRPQSSNPANGKKTPPKGLPAVEPKSDAKGEVKGKSS